MPNDENIIKAVALLELVPGADFSINEGVLTWVGPGSEPSEGELSAKISEVATRVGYEDPTSSEVMFVMEVI